jgi:hypothetical protein
LKRPNKESRRKTGDTVGSLVHLGAMVGPAVRPARQELPLPIKRRVLCPQHEVYRLVLASQAQGVQEPFLVN